VTRITGLPRARDDPQRAERRRAAAASGQRTPAGALCGGPVRRFPVRRRASPLLALLAALACGGGGGGGSGAASAPTTFVLAGDIEVAFATAADGDVNDPSARLQPNDSLGTAQELPNPVTLGGYVNAPGAGAPGRSFAAGDARDLFRVSLAAGQRVQLFLAGDGLLDDLDLALLALDGSEVLASDGVTPLEELSVPAAGDYVLEVSAFAGASNYLLVVGSESVPAAQVAPPPEFVPGELLVRFRDDAAGAGGGAERGGGSDADARRPLASDAVGRAAALRMSLRAQGPGGLDLLACRDGEELRRALRSAGAAHLAAQDPDARSADEDARMRAATRRLAKALRRRADVLSADLNYVRRPAALPADEHYPRQWHYPLIRLPEAWDQIEPASGVVVAVIDTGVAQGHPDLQGQLVPGYDFIQSPQVSLDGDGCDPDPEDPGDGFTPGSSSYHGTHVAGTVAARTSLQPGGDAVGVAGVAWNARVMPLRVLGHGGGSDFDVIQAVRYAAGLPNACGVLPDEPARVANLSLGGPARSSALEAALAEARAAGLTLVAAAGNFSSDAPFYPASAPGVISVSAVDAGSQLAPYSNYGATIDLAAPGGDTSADLGGDGLPDGVLSTLRGAAGAADAFVYGYYQGTSMAAPHVSGVVALMLGVNPDLTPADIEALLADGQMTRGLGSSLLYGAGLVDAFAAVTAAFAAQGGTPPVESARLEVAPVGLHFGAIGTLADVEVRNAAGSSPLAVESVTALSDDGAAWLSVEPLAVDGDGLGRYRVRVDRSLVPAGIYTGVLLFDSSANDVELPVVMQSGSAVSPQPDAGHHFVLLLDAGSRETVKAVAVNASGGRYRYRFDAIERGEYLIVAGSDADNDLRICDPGEACGAYATLDEPLGVVVESNRSGLDFVTSFGLRLSGAGARIR
jgi:serine protease